MWDEKRLKQIRRSIFLRNKNKRKKNRVAKSVIDKKVHKMEKNEQKKNHDNEKETVSFRFLLSVLLYTQDFRNKLEAARRTLEAVPKAELTSSYILIVSDELSDGKYAVKSTSFGSINTLAHVLIDKLIKTTPPEKEVRNQVPENSMDSFISETTARFFDNVENDKGTE